VIATAAQNQTKKKTAAAETTSTNAEHATGWKTVHAAYFYQEDKRQ